MEELKTFFEKSLLSDQSAQDEAKAFIDEFISEKTNIFAIIECFGDLEEKFQSSASILLMQFIRRYYTEYSEEESPQIFDFCADVCSKISHESVIFRHLLASIGFFISINLDLFSAVEPLLNCDSLLVLLRFVSDKSNTEMYAQIGAMIRAVIEKVDFQTLSIGSFKNMLYAIMQVQSGVEDQLFSDVFQVLIETVASINAENEETNRDLFVIAFSFLANESFNEEQKKAVFDASTAVFGNRELQWETRASVINVIDYFIDEFSEEDLISIIKEMVQLSIEELENKGECVESFSCINDFLEKTSFDSFWEIFSELSESVSENESILIVILSLINNATEVFPSELNSRFDEIFPLIQASFSSDEERVQIMGCVFINEAELQSALSSNSLMLIELINGAVCSENEMLQLQALQAISRLLDLIDIRNDDVYQFIDSIKEQINENNRVDYYECLTKSMKLLPEITAETCSGIIEFINQCIEEGDSSNLVACCGFIDVLVNRGVFGSDAYELISRIADGFLAQEGDDCKEQYCTLLYLSLKRIGKPIIDAIGSHISNLFQMHSEDNPTSIRITSLLALSLVVKFTEDSEAANSLFADCFSLLESLRESTFLKMACTMMHLIPLLSNENISTLISFIEQNISDCVSAIAGQMFLLLRKICKCRNEETSEFVVANEASLLEHVIELFRCEKLDLLNQSIFPSFCDFISIFLTTRIDMCKALIGLFIEIVQHSVGDESEEEISDNVVLSTALGTVADAAELQMLSNDEISAILTAINSKLALIDDPDVRQNIIYLLLKLVESGAISGESIGLFVEAIHKWLEEYLDDESKIGKKYLIQSISTFIITIAAYFGMFEENAINIALQQFMPLSECDESSLELIKIVNKYLMAFLQANSSSISADLKKVIDDFIKETTENEE